ncbi:MAG: hypothetical protein M0Q49_02405 [Porticoccaceae bacterium]|nr:hypothetical protein [Porticoccaceae bacterium]
MCEVVLLRESQPVARRGYPCQAAEWLINGGPHTGHFSFRELRAIAHARRSRWRIEPGQRYLKQVQRFEGRLCVFRAIPAIHAICLDHDLYDC